MSVSLKLFICHRSRIRRNEHLMVEPPKMLIPYTHIITPFKPITHKTCYKIVNFL
jgi:hypothetical protein